MDTGRYGTHSVDNWLWTNWTLLQRLLQITSHFYNDQQTPKNNNKTNAIICLFTLSINEHICSVGSFV